ncbi:MAG TPA: hypothetical protein VFT98_01065 [Myxococcota bacterium]|nr:hypothetical protein [Myxococcota bacterium]
MCHRSRVSLRDSRNLALAALAAAVLASPAFAQTVRETIITENPSRTPGGSCMYGGDGKLIYAPQGAVCPETQSPAALAPVSAAAPAEQSAAKRLDGLRKEAAAVLSEREHLDVEFARLREALTYEDRETTQRIVAEVLRKFERHLEREARLLQPLAANKP